MSDNYYKHLLLIIIVLHVEPCDVLINTAQLVKDQLAHRLITNIHRGGCGFKNSEILSKLCCGDCAKFFICTALGMKETGTFAGLPQELKVLSHHVCHNIVTLFLPIVCCDATP